MELGLSNLDETSMHQLGTHIAGKLFPGAFIALFGDLGAGKTTLTRAIGDGLGIDDIQSPTFTIVREHDAPLPLYHFDAYRLEGEDELYAMGFEDFLCRPGAIVMEWCENVPCALPENRLEIHICGSGAQPRSVTFISFGQAYDKILEDIQC